MTQNILVPMDTDPSSKAALEYALSEYPEATITVLHVITFSPGVAYGGIAAPPEVMEDVQNQATYVISDANQIAAEHNREIETVTQRGSPARKIIEYTQDTEVEHIIMGSHGRKGISRFVLGSVAERVMRRTPVPITIVRLCTIHNQS